MSEKPESNGVNLNGIVNRYRFDLEHPPEVDLAPTPAERKAMQEGIWRQRLVSENKVPLRHVQRTVNRALNPDWSSNEAFLLSKLPDGGIWFLIGPGGTGKTQLGAELIRSVARSMESRFTSAYNLYSRLKDCYNSGTSEHAVLGEHKRFGLLVIDEFAKRGDTDWEQQRIFELINSRYNSMKTTILIGNLDLKQAAESVGPSIHRRLMETGGYIPMNTKIRTV